MSAVTIDDGCAAAELPLLLTVEEAAAVLRIGRTLAYSLAHRYEESGGVAGLPVIRLGSCLRVPRWALLELACTGRVVALSELAAHIADFLSGFEDEPAGIPCQSASQSLAVEERAASRSKRPRRSSAAAGRVGQQLVLLPLD